MTKLQPWEPTPEQTYAAQLLASMATVQYTADQVGKDISTVFRWLKDPEFRALKDRYVKAISRSLAAQLEDGMTEMVSLWREMVRNEVAPDDGRLDRIAPIVREWFIRSIAYDDASPDDAARSPGMAQQINVYAGGLPEAGTA